MKLSNSKCTCSRIPEKFNIIFTNKRNKTITSCVYTKHIRSTCLQSMEVNACTHEPPNHQFYCSQKNIRSTCLQGIESMHVHKSHQVIGSNVHHKGWNNYVYLCIYSLLSSTNNNFHKQIYSQLKVQNLQEPEIVKQGKAQGISIAITCATTTQTN